MRPLENLLAYSTRLVLQYPKRVILTTLIPCLLATIYVAFVPINLSFFGLLPTQEKSIARYIHMNERLRMGSQMLLLIEGDDEVIDTNLSAILDDLSQIPQAKWVGRGEEEKWLEKNAPYLVEADMFQDWVRLATHPADTKSAARLAEKIQAQQKNTQKMKLPGKRLVLVELRADPLKTNFLRETAFRDLEAGTRQVLAKYKLTGEYAGFAALGSQDTRATMERIKWVTPIGLFVILLLLRIVERRFLHLAAIGLTMVLSAGAALGLVGLLTGRITVIEAFYGVMIFGLGADFAFHIMVRLREEYAKQKDYRKAMMATLLGVGPGIIAGAMTTIGAFLILSLSPDPGAMHLGLSGGIGLVICLFMMLTFLPAIWLLLEKREQKSEQSILRMRLLEQVARSGVSHWRTYLILIGLLMVGSFWSATNSQLETDLSKIFNRDVPAVGVGDRIAEDFGAHTGPWILETSTIEEARVLTAKAKALPHMGRVLSIGSLFPKDMATRQEKLNGALTEIQQQKATYEGLMPLMGDEEAEQLKQLVKVLGILEAAASFAPPTVEQLPPQLKKQFVDPSGSLFVYAYFDKPTMDSSVIRERQALVTQLDDQATSLNAVISVMIDTDKPWIKWVIGSILIFVLVWIWLDSRNLRFMILSMTPVVLAMVGTVGLLSLFEFRFTMLTMVTVPLIVGLGVDDGIHVVHRIRQLGGAAIPEATLSVGRAILMTTVSTCAGFSGLLFSNHPGMEGMATVLLVGLPICLFSSVICIPALTVALGLSTLPPEHPQSSD